MIDKAMKTAFLFSGQGSQYVGMLSDIISEFELAKSMVLKAEEILGYNLSNIMFNGPEEILKETRYTQPALFLHSAIVNDIVKDKIDYDVVAGHSVGEYAALYSAGVLNFEDALKLVALRGKLMFEAGEKEPGTMFAVINLDEDKLIELCNKLTDIEKRLFIVPANFNSPGQIVISGNRDYLRNNINKFKEAGAKLVKELVVSGAFHSPLMEPAKKELEEKINSIEFNNAQKQVYVNVTAKPLTSAKELKHSLIEQLTSPVLWTQTLINMKEDGINRFIEIGPGNVLQGLTRRTLNEVENFGIDKLEDVEKYF